MRRRIVPASLLAVLTVALALPTLTSYAYATFAKWSASEVLFYINPQNQDLPSTTAEAAVLTGMYAWNIQGGANFAFLYGGRVSDTAIGFDGRNVAIFRNTVEPSVGAIAVTYSWTNSGKLVDADIVFYDAAFTWVAGTGPCNGGVFVEDIAVHEFGHALGLQHSTDPTATMALGYSYCSQEFRTLAADDIAAIRFLYGTSTVVNTPPTVTITAPATGSSVTSGTAMTFTGAASDGEDGNLSSSITWTSSLDGTLGTGASLTRTLSTGTHVISAAVTDSRGASASAAVTVSVSTTVGTPASTGTNVALASAGAVATASSTFAAGYAATGVINGDRAGVNWENGGGWMDATRSSYPDWVEVAFAGSYSISQVNVFSVQDTYWAPSAPTSTQTFTAYGLRSFDVQYWTGSAWATVPGGSVTGNTLVWRTVTFPAVTTSKIRVVVNGTVDGYSRITEIEAITGSSQTTYETYTIVRQFPHDTAAFTQGLELTGGILYESTGLNGSSSLRQVDLATGAVVRKVDVPAQHFAEGMTLFQGKIFQLTWQSGICFVYNPSTFALTGQFSYSGEGWGLTHDSQYLIMSDGTNQIRFIDPATFQTVRTISVVDGQSAPVTRINELEYINGEIYANIWQTDNVIRINPVNGQILGWIDLSGLLPAGTSADVLNGIAYDAASGHLLVTGKLWPALFEITLRPVG